MDEPKPKSVLFTKNKLISIFFVGILLSFFLLYFPFFGFTFPPCWEREKNSPLSENLKNKKFHFNRPMVYGSSSDGGCIKQFKERTGRITTPIIIIGADYRQQPIKDSEHFTLESAFYMKNFGLSALGAGGKWTKYLVVKNDYNQIFTMYCSDLLQNTDITNLDCN